MESPYDSFPPPPKPVVPEQSFFREWRDFAIGMALLIAVLGGYIWLATSPSASSDQPEPKAEFPASASAPDPGTTPTASHEQGRAP
jgi:hypothetical protein